MNMSRCTTMTPEQLSDLLRKGTVRIKTDTFSGNAAPASTSATPEPTRLVVDLTTPKRRQPNKTESEYRRMLPRYAIVVYEGMRLYLANGHSYRPDWVVRLPVGGIECHEVKGAYIHSRDSRILFDQARQDWPCFAFVWARKIDGAWKVERYEANNSTTGGVLLWGMSRSNDKAQF
jgi:hypothetical protein